MASAATKILVVGPSWVGDMVMAQALFIAFKKRFPELIIDVLAPGWSLPLLERMPEVRKGIVMPLGHDHLGIAKRYRLGKQLRSERYDQAVLLPNSWKSALVPLFAKIPIRTGWTGEFRYGLLNDIRRLDEQRYPLMVERFVALAYGDTLALPESLPRPRLSIDVEQCAQVAEKFQLNRDRPVLALCPGAEFGSSKRWPEAYYADVAARQIRAGWQVWLFGSVNDHPIAEEIQRQLPEDMPGFCYDLTGKTALSEAIDLLSLADAVVSNDSGLMHVSAALNRPMVVVYGSTSPAFTPPLNDQVEVLSAPVDCGPCFQRECPLHHVKCMRDLPVERVIQALDKLSSKKNTTRCESL